MADLDTRQKRESGIGTLLSFARVLPLADGSNADSEDERAHLAFNYNGIATVAGGFTVPLALIHLAMGHN